MKTVPLDTAKHNRQGFDCGIKALNQFLQRTANQQAAKNHARTYVPEDEADGTRIAGFYTLTMIQFELSQIPPQLQKKHRPVQAAALIARLAVDTAYQGKGFGGFLLHDALCRLYQAAYLVGFPVVFVDAKDGMADFYRRYGFADAAANRLYITVETIRQAIAKTA